MMNKISWQRVFAIISLIALIFIIYIQVLHFGFVKIDDSVYVTQNSHVLGGLSAEGLKWAFTSTFAGFWHPITWLSLMLDAQIYGAWAGGYHLTNLLLHILSSLILFMILRRMTGSFWKSGFVAALFAIHPLHVESVAWIGERKDVLSAFWGMLTIYAYVYYVKRPGIKRYLLTSVFFFLGLMSKPMLVTMPFVLLLLDYWPLDRISFRFRPIDVMTLPKKSFIISKTASVRRVILEKVPLFILIIPISVVTFFAERKFGALPTMDSFPLYIRIYNALISYIRYIEKTILPINLSVYYPHPGMWPVWQVMIAGIIIILLSVWIFRKMNRYPYLTVGWLWYLGTLVPVIGFIQVGPCSMADRYTYIPIIGLFIMFAWGVPDLMRQLPYKKAVLSIGALLLVVVFSFFSWQRCKLWGDNYLLWDDVLKKYDISSIGNFKEKQKIAFAYNFRGLGSAEKGNYRQAIEDYNVALKINSQYGESLNNRANAYGMIGQNDSALRDFAQLIIVNPKFADAYYNRGNLYLSISDLDKAINDFTEAITIDPGMADAFNNRGVAFRLKGQYEKAFADFNQALSINRMFAEAYCNRGIVYHTHKQFVPAIANFTEALKIKPQYTDAYFNRGVSFAFLGKYDDAIRDFRQVLNINANYIPALENLGSLLKKMKRYEESSTQYKKILQIKPNDHNALDNLEEIEKLKRGIS
jgi:tetratricopeptide (TPR) repeat protein